MIVVLLLIPLSMLAVSLLPDKSQSTEIVSGIFIEEPDAHTESFVSTLKSSSTGFTFREYSSLQSMQDDTASGRIDAGYLFPAGISSDIINGTYKGKITVYTTGSTAFEEVSTEAVYAALLEVYAPDIALHMLDADSISMDSGVNADEYIKNRYAGYIENDDIFTIRSNITGRYEVAADIQPRNFPVEIFVYITIIICALTGLQNFLNDLECGVYAIVSPHSRISFCAKNIAAGIIPAAIINLISLLIYSDVFDFLHTCILILAVSLAGFVLCMILRFLFRNYKTYVIAMPFIIICTILLSLLYSLSQM